MRRLAIACSLLATIAASLGATPPGYRVVNVTVGSEPGWTPSLELEQEARSAVSKYLKALDTGNFGVARMMQGDGLQSILPDAQFRAETDRSRKEFGTLVTLNVWNITWTKDSPSAPLPGTYVAIDLANVYSLASRHCGYVILHKRSPEGPFKIVRTENTYMSNASAKSFGVNAAQTWKQVSTVCPGYAPAD